VYLVGAGPGDPDLITLRGAELLGSADAVLHDELVHPALLERARPDAELRPVGKRGHDHHGKHAAQQQINAELIARARRGLSVLRLKGGDPFVFGRGAEEASALNAAHVPFEIVPGVASPMAATAYAGVPLTHRALSSSVVFVTAVRHDGAPFDWSELAGHRGTLCVFMATRHLERICRELVAHGGRLPETPAAALCWLSHPRQRSAVGTLADLPQRAAELGIAPPSLLVVGEVAALREQLSWYERQPLFGKRVLVARPARQAPATMRLLRRRGAEPVAFPTIAIEPPPDPAQVGDAVRALASYQLVAFTSDNGVRALFDELERQALDARAFGRARLAAIGPATAAALSARGLRADIVATTFVAEQLAEAILAAGLPAGARVLLPRALVAREALPDALRRAGMQLDVVPVYQTVTASTERRAELQTLIDDIDVVLLTSSSTASRLCELLGDDAPARLRGCALASIGPVTTRTAERLGLQVAVTATTSTTAGLVAALEQHLAVTAHGVAISHDGSP